MLPKRHFSLAAFFQNGKISCPKLITVTLLSIAALVLIIPVQSQAIDPIEELEKEKNELQHLLDLSSAATKPLEAEVKSIESRINKAKSDLLSAQKQATSLGESIQQRELAMGSQYQVFSHRVQEQYKRSAYNTPFLVLLASHDAGLVLFVMIVWGGFEILSGASNSKSQDAGKQRITAAIIGFIILFAAYWLIQLLQLIFGIKVF